MDSAANCLPPHDPLQLNLFNDQPAFKEENRKIEILLVEDNPDEAGLTIRSLRKCGFVGRVVHLEGGKEVLDYLRSEESYREGYVKDSLKIILLDLRMPKVNGHEVLKKLRNDVLTMYLPVIMMSFSDYDPDVKEGYELGAFTHIVKPLSSFNFSQVIRDLRLMPVSSN